MRVVGIDPASHTGVVVLQNGEVVDHLTLSFEGVSTQKRLHLLQIGVASRLVPSPDLVCIESMGFGRFQASVVLVGLGTLIRQSMMQAKIPWRDVPPSVLKKFATGKGNADKKLIAKHVAEKWGFTSPSDDVIDAYVLARIAEDLASEAPSDYLMKSCALGS